MARYKDYDYGQSKLIPVDFDRQVLPGTFDYTLSYLIEHECDLSRAVLPPRSGCGTISLRRLPDALQSLAKELAESAMRW